MHKRSSSPILLIGIVVAAAAMGLVGFFWLGGPTPPQPGASSPVTEGTTTPTGTGTQKPKSETDPKDEHSEIVVQQPSPPSPPEPPKTPEEKAREDADIKIGTLLAQNPTVEGARDKLLTLFPGFNPYEKIAAAPHIVNLTTDEQLSTMVGFLKNPLTPLEAQETFFNDMLNRAPQTGWPVLVEVIATPNHPLADRAKELLSTIVGQDYGNDVFGWQRGLRDQLKQQGAIEDDAPSAATDSAPPQPQQ